MEHTPVLGEKVVVTLNPGELLGNAVALLVLGATGPGVANVVGVANVDDIPNKNNKI